MTEQPPKKTTSDIDLFREAVGEVKPVRHDRVASTRKPPSPKPRQFELDEKAVMYDAMRDTRDPEAMDCGEYLSWSRSGVQRRVMRKLRNGYYATQAELDLHGLTVDQAREAMQHFIVDITSSKGSCCVRIIHGKGRKTITENPILKPFTASWLRQRRDVLAYSSAKPVHGGTGALYVLLRSVEHR